MATQIKSSETLREYVKSDIETKDIGLSQNPQDPPLE